MSIHICLQAIVNRHGVDHPHWGNRHGVDHPHWENRDGVDHPHWENRHALCRGVDHPHWENRHALCRGDLQGETPTSSHFSHKAPKENRMENIHHKPPKQQGKLASEWES